MLSGDSWSPALQKKPRCAAGNSVNEALRSGFNLSVAVRAVKIGEERRKVSFPGVAKPGAIFPSLRGAPSRVGRLAEIAVSPQMADSARGLASIGLIGSSESPRHTWAVPS